MPVVANPINAKVSFGDRQLPSYVAQHGDGAPMPKPPSLVAAEDMGRQVGQALRAKASHCLSC
jgi:hypothetical protein